MTRRNKYKDNGRGGGFRGRRNTNVYFYFCKKFTKGKEKMRSIRNNSALCNNVLQPAILIPSTLHPVSLRDAVERENGLETSTVLGCVSVSAAWTTTTEDCGYVWGVTTCELQMRWTRWTEGYVRNRTETCKVLYITFVSRSENFKIGPIKPYIQPRWQCNQ